MNNCANDDQDRQWMQQALELARQAGIAGEVPVGAILVRDGEIIGRGWNQPIAQHDPSAHAEILALRDAGNRVGNYRLLDTTLYCTLEPCPMCASALINARVAKVVYGTADQKGGACGSVFNLLPSDERFNHRTACQGGVLAVECGEVLRQFFRMRRNGIESDFGAAPSLEALIFDVDGTLADNERDGHRVAFNRAFAELDLDWCWSTELYSRLLEVTGGKERLQYFIDAWQPLLPAVMDLKGFIAKLHQRKTAIYNEILKQGEIPLRPGILRLLRQAQVEGLKLAIATTTSLENVTALLRVTIGEEAIGWFEVIAAGSQVSAKKPAPDIYQYALQQLGMHPSACVVFEDSAIGLQAARAAGIETVVITATDYTRDQNFTGAALVLESLGEPGEPCQQLAGRLEVPEQIDLALIRQLHNPNSAVAQ